MDKINNHALSGSAWDDYGGDNLVRERPYGDILQSGSGEGNKKWMIL